jgi:hypothetical protein
MTDLKPSTAARLRAALRSRPSGDAPDGRYDVPSNERFVKLGQDHSRAEARMVSLHESFHSSLNSSSTFGTTMMFVGALAELDEPGFPDLLERMIGDALTTHETFATVAAVCALAEEGINDELLAAYPDYQGFLEAFIDVFGRDRPLLTAMALTSCARVAMQTSIYGQLLTTPCADWPSLTWPKEQTPDWRFRQLLQRAPVSAALAAVDDVLRGLEEPMLELIYPSLSNTRAKLLVSNAPLEFVEMLNEASYVAFAKALSPYGIQAPAYDEQRRGLSEVLGRVQAQAGDRLQATFIAPESLEDEVVAVMANYRRERLVLRERPDAARFLDSLSYGLRIVEAFIGTNKGEPYVHFVAMPKGKAAALYGPKDGWSEAQEFPGDMLTGLRRRYMPADGPPSVQFLLIRLPHLIEIMKIAAPGVPLVPVLSAASVDTSSWFAEWERYGTSVAPRTLVEVDTDPFALIDELGATGAPLHMSFAQHRADASSTASLIAALCIASESRPNQLYLLPASGPAQDAVLAYTQRKGYSVDVYPAFLEEWHSLLAPAFTHMIREEHCFGNRFWERADPV